MSDEIITHGRDQEHDSAGGREYLWFALLLIIVLVGVAGI